MSVSSNGGLTRAKFKTPKAAAIAGIVFSILLTIIFVLVRTAIPDHKLLASLWLVRQSEAIAVAVFLVPFTGVAFLWFIGVLRDRLGDREDRLFATVFLGSGLLFLAMLFAGTAVTGSILSVFSARPDHSVDPETYAFAWTLASELINVYALKMAAVFMMSTATLCVYTVFVPRYVAFTGHLLALFILFGSQYVDWSRFVFPVWILLLSTQMLVNDFRTASRAIEQKL
jgi:hypothetical protein